MIDDVKKANNEPIVDQAENPIDEKVEAAFNEAGGIQQLNTIIRDAEIDMVQDDGWVKWYINELLWYGTVRFSLNTTVKHYIQSYAVAQDDENRCNNRYGEGRWVGEPTAI